MPEAYQHPPGYGRCVVMVVVLLCCWPSCGWQQISSGTHYDFSIQKSPKLGLFKNSHNIIKLQKVHGEVGSLTHWKLKGWGVAMLRGRIFTLNDVMDCRGIYGVGTHSP
eukprot:scaffold6148_cov127-Cylindrotheca_fusiformis.AAC.6